MSLPLSLTLSRGVVALLVLALRRAILGLRLHGSLRLGGRGRVKFCCHSCTSWCISAVTIFLFVPAILLLGTKQGGRRERSWGPERTGGLNGVPEMGTRGIRVTGMLAWQRAF